MIFSPYTPGAGATPPALAGREDLLAEAETVLVRAAHFGAPGPAPLVWTGVRGVGKTVALGELRRRARRSFATVHVTADREGSLSARLAEAVASTLADEEVDRSGRRWSRLVERLAAFDLSVSVAGVLTVGTSARPQEVRGAAPARDDLRRLVEDACDHMVEAGRAGLLLDAADLVLSLSRGAPFLLQLYADGVWRAVGPERGGRLELEPARAGVLETEHRLWEGQYRGRWTRATPAEQALLVAIAARLGVDGTAAVSDVAAHVGRPVKALGPARAALIDKGLVEAPARGLLAFTVPGFEAFVRAQGDAGREAIDR